MSRATYFRLLNELKTNFLATDNLEEKDVI